MVQVCGETGSFSHAPVAACQHGKSRITALLRYFERSVRVLGPLLQGCVDDNAGKNLISNEMQTLIITFFLRRFHSALDEVVKKDFPLTDQLELAVVVCVHLQLVRLQAAGTGAILMSSLQMKEGVPMGGEE